MRSCIFLFALLAAILPAQTPPAATSLDSLSFLEGSWNAAAQGSTGAEASGYYLFRRELGGHVLARHSFTSACKGPADYNCEHSDLLYVYSESAGQPLSAIYFDSEGHTIHYSVSTPEPATAVFESAPAPNGPQFRLVYTLKAGVLSGKFQVRMPGQEKWNSYLEWAGSKKP